MQQVGVMQLSHVLVGLVALCGGGAVAVSFYEKLQCCVALLGPCRPRWRQLHEVAVGDVASMISVYANVPAVCGRRTPPRSGLLACSHLGASFIQRKNRLAVPHSAGTASSGCVPRVM